MGVWQPSGAWSRPVRVEDVLEVYTCGRLLSLGKGVKGREAVPPRALWAMTGSGGSAPGACAHLASWGMAGVQPVGANALRGGNLGVVSRTFSDPDLGPRSGARVLPGSAQLLGLGSLGAKVRHEF